MHTRRRTAGRRAARIAAAVSSASSSATCAARPGTAAIGDRGQCAALACRRAGDRRLDHAEPFLDLQRHGLAGGDALADRSWRKVPHASHHACTVNAMPAYSRRHEARLPAIVRGRLQPHRDAMPVRLVVRRPQQLGRQHVVAIGNDVGADRDGFADQTFHRKRAVGHLRENCLDGDPRGGELGIG